MLLRNKKVQKILFLKKSAHLTNQTIVSKILFEIHWFIPQF